MALAGNRQVVAPAEAGSNLAEKRKDMSLKSENSRSDQEYQFAYLAEEGVVDKIVAVEEGNIAADS